MRISPIDSDMMPVFEVREMLEILKKVKEQEKHEIESRTRKK